MWEGRGSWKDWVMPSGTGIMAGVVAGLGAAMLQPSLAGRFAALGSRMFPVAVGAAALAATVPTAWALRSRAERQPPLPDPASVSSLPAPVTPLGAPGWHVPTGGTAGEVNGSYWETVSETHYHYDSHYHDDGSYHTHSEPHTHYRQELRHFNYSLDIDENYGRMAGYESLDAAIADSHGDGPALVIENEGRYHLFRTDVYRHWGDIDHMFIHDQRVDAVISPSGRVWRAIAGRDAGTFTAAEQLGGSSRLENLEGDKVASYSLERRNDPHIRLSQNEGPGLGYDSLDEALGDAGVRSGDHAVVQRDGQYYVMSTKLSREPDRDATLRGLRTRGSAHELAALEAAGKLYVPTEQYWMTPGS